MSTNRATLGDLGCRNRSKLVRRLFFSGPLGRQDLARLTGLSSATVTNVMAALIAEGVVVEAGVEESDGGRPRVLLRVNGNHRLVAGVDVGETRVRVELFDLAMRKRAGSEIAIHPAHHEPGVIVEAIAKGLGRAMSDCSAEADSILGIGVGVPGVVESFGEQVVHAPGFGWSHVPLGGLVGSATVLIDETALYSGVGIANLVNLFNPERIVIGGWVGLLLGPALLPRIRDAAAAQALNYPFGRVSIELGRLGSDAVALGAATLVAEQFLTHGDAAVRRRESQPATVGEPVSNSPTLETAATRLT